MELEELYQRFIDSNGICTDSRKIIANSMFFALKGDNFNANEFADKALKDGCSYAVIDESEYAENDKCILVENVQDTLQQLANYHRRQFDIPIIAITGSNGKTTSKELMGAVLQKEKNVLITEGNLNNQLGVPFTLLKLTSEHDLAVIEMGASRPGDIQVLVQIAEPTIGIITNIGAAHLEGFGSLEGVIKTKTELYRYMEEKGGNIIFNQEDEILLEHLPVGKQHFSYGNGVGEVQGNLIELDPFVTFNWTSTAYSSENLKTNLVGEYNFTNFLLAVAVGKYFGISNENISAALTEYEPSNQRSQVISGDRNTLIVDCYNANPTSMKAAIESFAKVDHPGKLMILGDMLELGSISATEHLKIVELSKSLGLDAYLVGSEFFRTVTEYPAFRNTEALSESVDLSEISDGFILLKGSREIKLEELIPLL